MTLPFLVHTHIPKTGGSAFNQRFLFPCFGTNGTYLLYRYVFEAAHRLPTRHVSRAMRSYAATGHVPFGYFQRIYPDAHYVSIFRDPVARCLSFLNFVLATPDHKVHERLPTGLSGLAGDDPDRFVLAVLDEPRLAVVQSNVQVRLASGCARLGPRPVDALHLEVAEDNIRRDDYLIGDQADLAGFLQRIMQRFPMPSGPTPQPDAAAEKRLTRTLSANMLRPTTVGRLEDANRFDLRLYESIRRRTGNLSAAA